MNPWAKAEVQGMACGLVLGAVVLIGGRLWWPGAGAQTKQPVVPEVVRARRFEVVDAAGKTRASLCLFPDGSSALRFHDAAGRVRAAMGMTEDSVPALELMDRDGNLRAALGATSLHAVRTDEVRMRPESSLVLFDKDGKVMWKAP